MRTRLVYPDSYLVIVRNFVEDNKVRCFTYRQFRIWLYRQGRYRDLEWHTVERMLRKLASQGYLSRKSVKGKTLFCVENLGW